MSSITHLQKTAADTVTDKTSLEKPAKNISSKTAPAQTAKTSSAPTLPRSESSLATAAGLPQDKLSSVIVSFARFFSLPLKPQTLAAIRRQAFTPPLPQSVSANPVAAEDTSGSLTAKMREALSLAAAAAESKGVKLHPEGLEAYAQAVDPELQGRHEGGHHRGKQRRNQGENQEEKAPAKASPITASSLEKAAVEYSENDPLLAILNKLPGRDGQRWIVLPFDFSEDGRHFRVSIRILLNDEQNSAARMALDIAESGGNGRWLFMLEAANDRAMRLTVCLGHELKHGEYTRLKSELSSILEIPIGHIMVRTSPEFFPCETEGAGQMRSVDEEA